MTDLFRWNPFDELRRFADEFERRFSSWSRPGSSTGASTRNMASGDDGWHVRIALPGIAPENVHVEVAGRTLHVRAVQKEGENEVTYYDELFTLPEYVDSEKIAANCRHGLLELTLPYKDAVKPRRIEISTEDRKQLPSAA